MISIGRPLRGQKITMVKKVNATFRVHLVIAPVIHAGRRKQRKRPHHVAITLFGGILRGNYGLSLFS